MTDKVYKVYKVYLEKKGYIKSGGECTVTGTLEEMRGNTEIQ